MAVMLFKALPLALGTTLSVVQAQHAAVVAAGEGHGVELRLEHGQCAWTEGPLEKPLIEGAATSLGLWAASKKHILCMTSSWLEPAAAHEDDEEISLVAEANPSRHPRDSSDQGQFGFGHGIKVNLRPQIMTHAQWPLQAGVPSLGVRVENHDIARALAFHVSVGNKPSSEVPVVVVRPREAQLPVDVQLLNESLGSCMPDSRSNEWRFVCRTGEPGAPVQLVIFCSLCFHSHLEPSSRYQTWSLELKPPGDNDNGREFTGSATTEPWLGLSTAAPQPGKPQHWGLVLLRDGEEHQAFELHVVDGNEDVAWAQPPTSPQPGLRLVGRVLMQMAVVAVVASLAVCLLVLRGLPVAPAALVPGISSAAGVLQYLALLAVREDAPTALKEAFSPAAWFAVAPKFSVPFELLGILACVVVVHALVAVHHLMVNGHGAAEEMPHSLSFGAWELRALSFLALPISSTAVSMVAPGISAIFHHTTFSFHDAVNLVQGLGLMAVLVSLGLGVRSRVRSCLEESSVICVQHPITKDVQFVDRICDQLHAMPLRPGKSRIWGDWLASRAWSWQPALATIAEVQHHGAPKDPYTSPVLWPADGPWLTDGATVNRSTSSVSVSDRDIRQRSTSSTDMAASRPSRDQGLSIDRPLLSRDSTEPPQGPLLGAHPVQVTTKFVFQKSVSSSCVAGVAGLTWLDSAISAEALQKLESQLRGTVSFRAQALQLAGPLTSGRLSACFELCDRQPWRWTCDLFLKIMLGVMAASFPSAMNGGYLVLNVLWLLLLAAMPVVVLSSQPHVHWVDNLAAFLGVCSLPLGTMLYQRSNNFSESMLLVVAIVLLVLAYVPVVVTLLAAVLSLRRGLCWTHYSWDSLLPRLLVGWGDAWSSRNGTSSSTAYQVLGAAAEDDDLSFSMVGVAPQTSVSNEHAAEAVVVVPPDSLIQEPLLRATLPCEVKVPIAQVRLWTKGPAAVSSTDANTLPRLALPAALLFGQKNHELAIEFPLAAVLTPEDGILLYANEAHNGDMPWPKALHRFLGGDHPGLAKEAERVLAQHVANQPRPHATNNGTLAVLEVLGPA